MKLWLTSAMILLLLSGCNTRNSVQLQNKNAQQALLIQQQQATIETLNKKLGQPTRRSRSRRVTSSALPPTPKKNIKLKKVEDTNFNSDYMYPQTKKAAKKPSTVTHTKPSNTSMTKEACIAMIGEDKFNKYTQMFGNEAASIKRCAMLKAMKS